MNKRVQEVLDGLLPLLHVSLRHTAKSLKNQTNIKPQKHGLNQLFPSISVSYYLKENPQSSIFKSLHPQVKHGNYLINADSHSPIYILELKRII